MLYDEPLVPGRTPQTNRHSTPQLAYFYAASLAHFCSALDSVVTKRCGLDNMLASLEAGDTLVVWKLDRLGRSTIHLLQLLSDLRDRGVDFQAITQGIDTTTAVGRMLYGQLAVFAEYERSLISERTKAGMAAAKARGVHVGRPRLSKTMNKALDELEKFEVVSD
ncbi:recombinase family protein [Halocynthiibacter namhaensis]|uniref:recombinase family protein n=1 Tax=Halocynthiibacter namhaensis TaxID=1290553 RepID=UPI001EE2F83F|nr:recombinase family protein [Halocynthiibacter namhaensis]